MDYFQINKYQESILRTNANGCRYIIVLADNSKDDVELYTALLEHQQWTEQLVAEGLMTELPTEGDQFIEQMTTRNQRTYRMFQLTDTAQKMFSPVLVEGSERGTFRNAADTIH